MKTQRQSPRLALRLSAVEATRWCRLGFQVEDDSRDHVERCAEQILQIDDDILYIITPWQYPPRLAILYLITPWQHAPRLGMLFYIL